MAAHGSNMNTVIPKDKRIKDPVLLRMNVKKLGNITIDELFDRDELKRYDFDNEIDQDMHYYSNLDINCNYYTDQEFNKSVEMYGALSVIHFNSRGQCKNYSAIKEFLKS